MHWCRAVSILAVYGAKRGLGNSPTRTFRQRALDHLRNSAEPTRRFNSKRAKRTIMASADRCRAGTMCTYREVAREKLVECGNGFTAMESSIWRLLRNVNWQTLLHRAR